MFASITQAMHLVPSRHWIQNIQVWVVASKSLSNMRVLVSFKPDDFDFLESPVLCLWCLARGSWSESWGCGGTTWSATDPNIHTYSWLVGSVIRNAWPGHVSHCQHDLQKMGDSLSNFQSCHREKGLGLSCAITVPPVDHKNLWFHPKKCDIASCIWTWKSELKVGFNQNEHKGTARSSDMWSFKKFFWWITKPPQDWSMLPSVFALKTAQTFQKCLQQAWNIGQQCSVLQNRDQFIQLWSNCNPISQKTTFQVCLTH